GSAENTWRTEFVLTRVGREKKGTKRGPVGNCITNEHTLCFNYDDYSVLYDHKREGMEQSFLVKKKPAGPGILQIALRLEGDLEARLGQGNQLFLYRAGHPQDIQLTYDQLI